MPFFIFTAGLILGAAGGFVLAALLAGRRIKNLEERLAARDQRLLALGGPKPQVQVLHLVGRN